MAGHEHAARSAGTLTATRTKRWLWSLLWLGAAMLMTVIVLARLTLTFDLSAFLPRQTTPLQEVLVEQIRNGPASRLLVIGISGADADVLAEASEELKQALAAEPDFTSVANGQLALDDAEVPAPVDRYYLLMRDLDYSRATLAGAVQSRLRDLAFAGGRPLIELIARDPFLATLDILERLSPADIGGELWFAETGSAVLIAETRAGSIDIGAQREALATIRETFAELPDTDGLDLEITGVGAFSVELQETIRAEATLRSILASLALLLVLLLAFRSPRLVLAAALPLGMGFLGGLALVSLLFAEVHGITLAFGFTMLGVAIDYPIHLFSHARGRSGPEAMQRIWPTMRLGVISTSIAYLALVFSGSSGLAQLGSFTVAGVVIAMLVTRTWLPFFAVGGAHLAAGGGHPAGSRGVEDAEPVAAGGDDSFAAARAEDDLAVRPALSLPPGLIVLVAATAVAGFSAQEGLWNDNVSSLSPVPADRLAVDNTLRAAATTPDMRYQLVLFGSSLQALLGDCERTDPLLREAQADGMLEGWQSVCQLLPSRAAQTSRQAAIPDRETLRQSMRSAVAGTPFREAAFDPFLEAAAEASSLEILDPAAIAGTPLAAWLDAHLLALESNWVALISLVGPQPAALQERVAQWPVAVTLVDIQGASIEMMQDYRRNAVMVIAVAALLILALLWYGRGELRQTLWIAITVSAALSATIAVAVLVHGSLTVMHLVALLLVLGLGLDYALFVSRVESAAERECTRRGIFLCAISTTLAFGILAGSSIPVLKYLGLTVATGSVANFLLAWFGSRGYRRPAR
jgi:predicted exporter